MGDRVGWQQIPRTYRESGARIIGLTATPARAEGRALPDFDALVVAANYSSLIASGHLVAARVFVPEQDPKTGRALSPLRNCAGMSWVR
jgi:superfamily II DNA or RNA helicase